MSHSRDVWSNRRKRGGIVPPATFADIISRLDTIGKETQCTITGLAIDTIVQELKALAKHYGESVVQPQLVPNPDPAPKQPKSKPEEEIDWGEEPPF